MKMKSESEVAQLCSTPSDPMDCSLPGSSVHGIFQARVLEWVAIAFSDGLIHRVTKIWTRRNNLALMHMRTAAWEPVPQIALRNCSKEVVGKVYM